MKSFLQQFDALDENAKEALLTRAALDMEGEAGLALRAEHWSGRLGRWAEGCAVGRNAIIEEPENLFMYPGSRIGHNCYIRAGRAGGVTLGPGARIKENCILDVERPDQGFIRIGADTYLGAGAILYGHVGLTIGDGCMLGQRITVTPFQHAFADPSTPIKDQGGEALPVVIEDNCYIGMCSTLMLGVTVGRGAVVGAGSLVRGDVAPFSVVAGAPARLIRGRGPRTV